jgi:plasmid maintenance system antidote protein VapI
MMFSEFLEQENEIQYSSIPQGNTSSPRFMVRFAEFHTRLIACLRDKVRSGELTERGLARMIGISQPHIHNVLKGKKVFSAEVSDAILRELDLDLLDLLDPAELRRKARRVDFEQSARPNNSFRDPSQAK